MALKGKLIGYAREWLGGPSIPEQIAVLQGDLRCWNIYSEANSVTGSRWPELELALMDLRPRDCLVVVSLFCIGFGKRRLSHVLKSARDNGADFWAVEQQLDTRRSALLLPAMLQSLELLRASKSTATKEGLEEARSKGRVGGRRPVLSDEKISRASELIAAGHHTMAEIAKLLGVSRSSLYNSGLSVRRAV